MACYHRIFLRISLVSLALALSTYTYKIWFIMHQRANYLTSAPFPLYHLHSVMLLSLRVCRHKHNTQYQDIKATKTTIPPKDACLVVANS